MILAELNGNAFDSAEAEAEPNNDDAGDDAFHMRKVLSVLMDIKDGQSEILQRISEIESDIKAIRETRELEAEAMQAWRPQVSNDVKDIGEKLSVAEKR